MTDAFVDPFGGANGNNGTSFASRKQTVGSVSGLSGGDRIKLMKSPDPEDTGVDSDWVFGSDTIGLASPLTELICDCESNWTGSGVDGISTLDAGTYRTGTHSVQLQLAYLGYATFSLGGTFDFSAFEKISFQMRLDSIGGNPNDLQVWLIGAGGTDFLSVPFSHFIAVSGWHPITLDNGGPLRSDITQIRFYLNNQPGSSVVFHIDHILACNKLTLTSLVGKNTGTESWQGVREISSTDVILDSFNNNTPLDMEGYGGVTETVSLWVREPLIAANVISTSYDSQVLSLSGTSVSSLLTLSGGWDETAMSSQTGETWIDGRNASPVFNIAGSNIFLEKTGVVRGTIGWSISGSTIRGSILGAHNCIDTGIYPGGGTDLVLTGIGGVIGNNYGIYYSAGDNWSVDNFYNVYGNRQQGINQTNGNFFKCTGVIEVNCNAAGGMTTVSSGGVYGYITAKGNGAHGVSFGNKSDVYCYGMDVQDNGTYGLRMNGAGNCDIMEYNSASNSSGSILVAASNQVEHLIANATIAESTKVVGLATGLNQRVKVTNRGGVLADNITYIDGGNISVDTTDPATPGGKCFLVNVTAAHRNALNPIELRLQRVAVKAGSLVTLTCKIKKSHATNISADFMVRGAQVEGITVDVVDSATTTSYAVYTVTFTPTQKGVVQPIVNVYSETGSTSSWVRVADQTREQA